VNSPGSPWTGPPGRGAAGPLHILVLCDRDWTHPQGGGSGANLREQSLRWAAWGHRVSFLACSYPGAPAREVVSSHMTLHRVGTRSTVFPRAIWRQARGLVPDADVVLEVINGITFLTPLWLRTPRVALMNHRHRLHYRLEMGTVRGATAGFALETMPLRALYGRTPFIAVSKSTARELEELGVPGDLITVNYTGLDAAAYGVGDRALEPTILYLGRIKRYKHIEVLLDVLDAVPSAVLEIAGDGDHRPQLERAIAKRGLTGRVRLHGAVDEATKRRLLQRAWVHATASRCEGWCLAVMEAAACGTTTAALRVGGVPESVVHGSTGLLAGDDAELVANTARLLTDRTLRERLAEAAFVRAQGFSWDEMAVTTLVALEAAWRRARRTGLRPVPASVNGRLAHGDGPGAMVEEADGLGETV
jgi:glycosyltransferase involved in cell wall biosynthesis